MKFQKALALTSERVLELLLLLKYFHCDDMGGDSIDVFSCDEVRVRSSRDDNRPSFFREDLSNRAL